MDVNRGYQGWSMSKRAAAAYQLGEKPLSKFTRADLDSLEQICQRFNIDLRISTVKELKAFLFSRGCSSWHHTSKYFNSTEFYALWALGDLNDETEEWDQDAAAALAEHLDAWEKTKEFQKRMKEQTEQRTQQD